MDDTQVIHNPLSARIKEARRVAALTQQELADLIGCSARAVQEWEGGRVEPRGPNLRRLAEATGRPVAWFFEDDTNGKAA